MKFILLFFIISLNSVFCQDYERATVFEDYRKCLAGFQKGNDTIWPAIFESTINQNLSLNDLNAPAWLVKKDGRYGLLSAAGEVLIPFEYDDLELFKEITIYRKSSDRLLYLAEKNGKRGIIDSKGEVVVPMDEQSIKPMVVGRLAYCKVMKQGRFVLYDVYFKQLCTLPYEDVGLVVDNVNSTSKTHHFLTYSNGKVGCLDSLGKEIFRPEYANIKAGDWYCDDDPSYFILENTDNTFAIGNIEGKIVYSFRSAEDCKITFIDREKCKTKSTAYAIILDKNQYYAVNLQNGEKSKKYNNISPFFDAFLIETNKGSAWMDANFKIIKKPDQIIYSYLSMDGGTSTYFSKVQEFTQVVHPNVLATSNAIKRNKMNGIRHWESEAKFSGLYNLRNGLYLEHEFHSVDVLTDGRDTMIWCFNISTSKISIFLNRDFKQINTLELTPNSENQMHDNLEQRKSKRNFRVIRNSAGKYGTVDFKGNVIIPFEFTQYSEVQEWYFSDSSNFPMQFSKDSLVAWFKPNGEVLIPLRKQSIRVESGFEENKPLIVARGDICTIYDHFFNIFLDSISQVSAYTNDYRLKPTSGLLVSKNEHLYVFGEHGFQLLDSTKIDFKWAPVLLFQDRYLIDRKGKILASGSKVVKKKEFTYVMENNKLIILDKNWDIIESIDNVMNFEPYYSAEEEVLIGIWENGTKKGIYNVHLNKWIIEPNYNEVIKESNGNYWLQKERGASWQVINPTNHISTEAIFDFPVHIPYKKGFIIFSQNKLLGLMDLNFQIIEPAKYVCIVSINKLYFFKEKNLWGAINSSGKSLAPQFTDVPLNYQKINTIVILSGKLGMLNDELEWIIPPSNKDFIVNQISIEAAFKSKQETTSGPQTAETKINNLVWWERIFANLYDDKPTVNDFNSRSRELYTLDYSLRIKGLCKREIRAQFGGDMYCSIIAEASCEKQKNNKLMNFKISGDSLLNVSFRDIINVDTEDKFDEILTNYIVKKQIFGMQCPDLIAKIDNYKKTFCFHPKGLEFYQPDFNHKILIEYKDLKEILKEIDSFF